MAPCVLASVALASALAVFPPSDAVVIVPDRTILPPDTSTERTVYEN